MKISLKWINEFVDVSDYFEQVEKLSHILTQAGLEVEEVHNLAAHYQHVVTGIILEKEKHPDADKLSVCKVTTGDGVIHQIVCGAKNHKQHDHVIVALPGAILPGNFAIKQTQIRGVDSSGMLCSFKELGLAETSDGIAILPENTPVGISFAKYHGLDDIVFELKVTPNRADCLSHWGLAREISCLLNRPLNKFKPQSKQYLSLITAVASPTSNSKTFKYEGNFKVEVKDSLLCPRYSGRIIRGVKVGPSPNWLKEKLERVGMSSINNIVDITNLMMLGWGQPMHAFDLNNIKGSKIIVGRSDVKEKFQTLDGTELVLDGSELMIRDIERSLCMAGVIGGKNSGINDLTTDVFLESAYFTSQSVRKASRTHGIVTDSGYRFSRGVDPIETVDLLNLASQLLIDVAGGEMSEYFWEEKAKEFVHSPIEISVETVKSRLGYDVDASDFEQWMKRLGCSVEGNFDGLFKVTPPSWRFDISIDMDLVEEYARLHGYEHIPESIPAFFKNPTPHSSQFLWQNNISDIMIGTGWSQAQNFAFVNSKEQSKFYKKTEFWTRMGLSSGEASVSLVNPLNEEMNVMRSTLILNLIANAKHNYHHGVNFGRLFEVGSVFEKDVVVGVKASNAEKTYLEKSRLSGVAWGWPESLWGKTKAPLALHVKGAIENLFAQMGFSKSIYECVNLKDALISCDFLHAGQSAVLKVSGLNVGFIGALHPQLQEELKIRSEICIFEFNSDFINKHFLFLMQSRMSRTMAPSKMPSIDRDLAFVMSKTISVGKVTKTIFTSLNSASKQILKQVDVVDIFEGESIGPDNKSVTFRLMFQHQELTLTEEQIQEAIKGVVDLLKDKMEINLR